MKDLTLQFTPFSSEIIGVDEECVYLIEYINEQEECVLKIKRKLYLEGCNMWLDSKADYCKRYNHFCGVLGSISILEYKQRGEITISILDNDNDYKNVPLYEVELIDSYVDMEHG